MKTFDIQPISVGDGLSTKTAKKIAFKASYIPESTSMDFSYQLIEVIEVKPATDTEPAQYKENGIYAGFDTLGEDVLAGWGTDDSYIYQACADKVGVVLV
jgi:hypothetical protein